MLINNTLCYCFLETLYNIEKLENFVLFICFLLNFIVLRSRDTSIWYYSITSIRDQVIIFVLRQ